jgi:hypothetical protein
MAGLRAAAVEAPPTLGDATARGLLLRAALLQGASAASYADGHGHHGASLLSGHLPSTLLCLSGIKVPNIAHNQLTGELPELVCDLRRITNLSVAFNFFFGISEDCYRLAGRSMFA